MGEVLPAYDIGAICRCVLLAPGLNDTYLVETSDASYVLRVYQAPRPAQPAVRSESAIRFELELLRHLAQRGVAVSVPVRRRDGEDIIVVDAPEGVRYAVLFTYAPGAPVTPPRQVPALAERYGRAVATIHTATDDFTSGHARFALDRALLIDMPLRHILPRLAGRSVDDERMRRLAGTLAVHMEALAREGADMGNCHGDAQGGNAHQSDDGTLTIFDFDLCGRGLRAYDIGVFFWGASLGMHRLGWSEETVRALCDAYLRGYREVRLLASLDEQAIPALVAVRQLWYLGHVLGGADIWGLQEASDRFLDRELAFLWCWVDAHGLEL